jgi:hypothetical protein
MFKKTIQLLIILIVLSVIFYLIHRQQQTEKEIPYFAIDSTQVNRIDISTQKEKVILIKSHDQWKLIYPIKWDVNKDQINLFFSKALKVKVTKTPMSENVKNQDKYRVTPDKALVLSMYNKRSHLIDRVYIGKSLNYSFCYARRPGSNAIYQLKDNIYDDINPSIFIWRSPVIASIILQNLAKVEVVYANYKYRMILENQTWFYENPKTKFPLDPTNLATGKFFNALTSLESYQFIDNRWSEYQDYFKKPAAIVEITDKFGKKTKLTFALGLEDTVYLMKDDNKNTLYLMNIDMLNRFTVAAEHFKNSQ